jgi:hypothetical protein
MVIIVQPPPLGNAPSLLQAQEQLPVQQLVPQFAVEALHIRVLPWTARLDVQRPDA